MFERPKLTDLELRARRATPDQLQKMVREGRADPSLAWMIVSQASALPDIFRSAKPSRSLAGLVAPNVMLYEGSSLLFSVAQAFLAEEERMFPLGALNHLGEIFERYAHFTVGALPSVPGASVIGMALMSRSWAYMSPDPKDVARRLCTVLVASLGKDVPLGGADLDSTSNIWRSVDNFPVTSDTGFFFQTSLAYLKVVASVLPIVVSAARMLGSPMPPAAR